MPIDATQIRGNLYQGGEPPTGPALCKAGFDVLVLCASQVQPEGWRLPGLRVIRIPLDDVPVLLTKRQLRDVRLAAQTIAGFLEHGNKVLVTCQLGLNRSGLVVADTLLRTTSMSPVQVIKLIRSKRGPHALSNPAFIHALVTDLRKDGRRVTN